MIWKPGNVGSVPHCAMLLGDPEWFSLLEPQFATM